MNWKIIALLLSFHTVLSAQMETITITLPEVIQIAQGEAPVALIARTRLSNNYWRYQSFLGDYKPQLSFNSGITLDRTIDVVTLDDGSDIFINRSQTNSNLGIEMSQRVPQTGGFFYARTGLRRIDLFRDGSVNKSYLATPLIFGFDQPIFQFNSDKWLRRLSGLEYQSAKKLYVEEREQIAYDAVDLFFSLYISQLNLNDARRQQTYADSLYETSKGRFEVGRIAETDLLQIELRAKNAETNVANELLNFQAANESLRNFLGFGENIQFQLVAPDALPEYDINAQEALEHARRNRSLTTEFSARLMEAQMNLEEARKGGGVNLRLNGFFGLTQTADQLNSAFRNPIDQERVTLGLGIPIADWGKRRAEREIAKSNLELTERSIEQENIAFERQILLRVQQMELKRLQLELATRAFEVAIKRVEIAKNRYEIGKIGVTELNIALNESDQARRGQSNALWSLWTSHYEIRNLTLYDFISNDHLTDKSNTILSDDSIPN